MFQTQLNSLQQTAALGWNPTKTKVQLKVAINRLKLVQQKKASINQQARKDIALLLEKGKDDSARVRVEHIIREDFMIEALELLELHAETLLARFGLVETAKYCDAAIAESVNTIIYSAPRVDNKELSFVRDQLIAKYGKDFAVAAMENADHRVSDRVIHKLQVQTPDPVLVNQYLKTIASAYNVAWDPPAQTLLQDPAVSLGLESIPGLPPALQPLQLQQTPLQQIQPIQQLQQIQPIQQQQQMPQQQQQMPQQQQQQFVYAQQYPLQANAPAAGYPQQPLQPLHQQQQEPPMRMPMTMDAYNAGIQQLPPPPPMQAPPQPLQQQAQPARTSQEAGASSSTGTASDENGPDFDELARRFEALKKRK